MAILKAIMSWVLFGASGTAVVLAIIFCGYWLAARLIYRRAYALLPKIRRSPLVSLRGFMGSCRNVGRNPRIKIYAGTLADYCEETGLDLRLEILKTLVHELVHWYETGEGRHDIRGVIKEEGIDSEAFGRVFSEAEAAPTKAAKLVADIVVER